MDIEDLPTGPGEFFKADKFKDAVALLVEVKQFTPDMPSNFGPKDTIKADIHAFIDADAVKSGTANVYSDVMIQQGALVRDLKDLVGKATITQLGTAFFKKAGKEGSVWKAVDPSLKPGVVEYAKGYQERLKAAMDDAPSFDDED